MSGEVRPKRQNCLFARHRLPASAAFRNHRTPSFCARPQFLRAFFRAKSRGKCSRTSRVSANSQRPASSLRWEWWTAAPVFSNRPSLANGGSPSVASHPLSRAGEFPGCSVRRRGRGHTARQGQAGEVAATAHRERSAKAEGGRAGQAEGDPGCQEGRTQERRTQEGRTQGAADVPAGPRQAGRKEGRAQGRPEGTGQGGREGGAEEGRSQAGPARRGKGDGREGRCGGRGRPVARR